MIDLKELFLKIYYIIHDFLSKESSKLLGIIALIGVFLWYILKNKGLFEELDQIFDDDNMPDEEGEILTLNKKWDQYINKSFNKYCKEIIDSHTEKIKLYDNVVSYLVVILVLLLLYYMKSGFNTYFVTPNILENGKGGIGWGILRFIFKWPYLGFLFSKNRNLRDILDFKLLGFMAKQSKLLIYMIIILLYLVYVILSIYIIYKFKNNSNNCYIFKNTLRRDLYPENYKYYNDKIKADIVKYHSIFYNNILMLIILIILYGFNSDILVNFANLFISNTHYIDTITKKFTNTNGV